MKKFAFLLALLLAFAWYLAIPLRAEEGASLPDGFTEAADQLPEEIRSELPSELFSEDMGEAGAAIGEMVGAEYLIKTTLSSVGVELGGALRLLAILCGLLMISAVFGTIKNSLGSEHLASAFRFCSTAAIFSAIISLQFQHLERVEKYFERLSSLMDAMIPALGALWAAGGNVTTASAGNQTPILSP